MTTLQNTLTGELNSHWQANPAMSTLINDYTTYHAVLVFIGSFLALASIGLAILFWIKFKSVTSSNKLTWSFDKKIYFSFGLTCSFIAIFIGLIVGINATNAFDPIPGFSIIANSSGVLNNTTMGLALDTWINSKSNMQPTIIKEKIQDRLSWQKPKAVICTILFVIFVFISFLIWKVLVEKRVESSRWKFKEIVLFITGVIMIIFTLLLMVMAVANMQAVIAPITITILGSIS